MLNARLDRAPMSRTVRVASALALAMITLPLAGFGAARETAQARASLIGTVVDQSGAPVPQAQVTLLTAGGESRTAPVDANGQFTYDGLNAGAYVIDVRAEGFAVVEDRVTLSSDQRLERRVTLPLGIVEETILIAGPGSNSGDAPTPQAEHAAREAAERDAAQHPNRSIQPPTRVRMVQPEYPEQLRTSGVGGVVTMDTQIAVDGSIPDIEVSPRAHPELAAAASEAVRQWRYTPTLLHGVPVPTRMKVTIEFRP